MLRLAPGPDSQAAAAIVVAANDGNGAKIVEILRRFDTATRVAVGAQAIELGADRDTVALAIKAAAFSQVEAVETEIQMDAVDMRRVFTPPWYKSTTAKIAGLALLAAGAYYYSTHKPIRR